MVAAGEGRTFVWDASALHHVGKAGRLDVLGSFTLGPPGAPWRHVVTELVASELDEHDVATPDWCEIHVEDVESPTLDDLRYQVAFSAWLDITSEDGIHDTGEASVAALVETAGGVAIIDDKARNALNENGIEAHGSMWLLCQSIDLGQLDVSSASNFADAVKEAGAWLPFAKHGFAAWARRNKLIS